MQKVSKFVRPGPFLTQIQMWAKMESGARWPIYRKLCLSDKVLYGRKKSLIRNTSSLRSPPNSLENSLHRSPPLPENTIFMPKQRSAGPNRDMRPTYFEQAHMLWLPLGLWVDIIHGYR
jgi:hypothetical protein